MPIVIHAHVICETNYEWTRLCDVRQLQVELLMSNEPKLPAVEELAAQGKAGEPITLPIARGPATGYEWRLELPQGVQRIEDGPAPPVDPSVRSGGAAGGYLRVTAAPGDYVILGKLMRPWDPSRPARFVRIRLHVE